jgi:hypothetical protein
LLHASGLLVNPVTPQLIRISERSLYIDIYSHAHLPPLHFLVFDLLFPPLIEWTSNNYLSRVKCRTRIGVLLILCSKRRHLVIKLASHKFLGSSLLASGPGTFIAVASRFVRAQEMFSITLLRNRISMYSQ